jgi:hypothetical protein
MVFRVLFLIVVCGLTVFLAVAPGSYSPLAPLVNDWVPWIDHRYAVILAHLVGFGGLVVLVTWLWGRLLPAALAVFAFSAVLEALQTQIAWRNGSWSDLGLNAVAVLLGVLVAWGLLRVRWIRSIDRGLEPDTESSISALSD